MVFGAFPQRIAATFLNAHYDSHSHVAVRELEEELSYYIPRERSVVLGLRERR